MVKDAAMNVSQPALVCGMSENQTFLHSSSFFFFERILYLHVIIIIFYPLQRQTFLILLYIVTFTDIIWPGDIKMTSSRD